MASFDQPGKQLCLLLVCNGMEAGKLAAVVDKMKTDSKGCGTHKMRALLWDAYGAVIGKLSGVSGDFHGFLTYAAGSSEDDAGAADVIPFTKKQAHALSQGGLELFGKKHKPLEEPESSKWVMAYAEDEARAALDDIRDAEACVYLTSTAAYVGTRYKRRQCKTVSGVKAPKDLEKVLESLPAAMQSVDWHRQNPPALGAYNCLVAGPGFPAPLLAALPAGVGRSDSSSPGDVYDAFLARRSAHYVSEAERLLDQLEADLGRGETKPLVVATMKEASTARKNALMKRAFVHASKAKFIAAVRADGDVELFVVTGDAKDTKFDKYGGIVAELFYRADLSVYG